MRKAQKLDSWLRENIPMFVTLYDNKYMGMLYDRFASLPSDQQRRFTIIGITFVGLLIVGILFNSYMTLWSYTNKVSQSYEMVNMLVEYQKDLRNKTADVSLLDTNKRLSVKGELKKHLESQGRFSNIAARLVQVEEHSGPPRKGDPGNEGKDASMKHATVKLEKVNLSQLKDFINKVEFGRYKLSISSIKIKNDEQIRGYMNVELTVDAVLFNSGVSG